LVTAVILIKVEPLKEKRVYRELQKIGGIADLHQILGLYDIYLKIECETYEELSKIVLDEIRNIPGVVDTRTLPEARFGTL
jgi:DNA-binding Lrp family transcriptional regulator